MGFVPVPNSGDSLGGARVQMRTNTNVLRTTIAVNHVDVNSAGAGKHKFIQMPEQSPNGPVTAVDEGALYTKDVAGRTQLLWRPENQAAIGTEIALTAGDVTNANFAQSQGWSFLLGNILIQYGQVTNPGTSGSVTFATNGIAFPNAVFRIMLTLRHNSSANESATVRGDGGFAPTTTVFSYRTTSSSANTVLYWLAIGN